MHKQLLRKHKYRHNDPEHARLTSSTLNSAISYACIVFPLRPVEFFPAELVSKESACLQPHVSLTAGKELY